LKSKSHKAPRGTGAIKDKKEHSPSAARNRKEILPHLRTRLPDSGMVLEIASGTGQHSVHFAAALPEITWQPSEKDPENLRSIRAWREEAGLPNLLPPILLDICEIPWPIAEADAIFASNMIHITPWETCLAFLEGAARTLKKNAPLIYYGALFRRDRETAAGNRDFDQSLRNRNPQWGVRWLEDIQKAARQRGLGFVESLDLPNNNYLTVFRRS
jgi:hypothetical protein